MRIKLAVFDLDGTLIDSANSIYLSSCDALKELSIIPKYTFYEFRKLIGMNFQDTFERLDQHIPDFDLFIEIYKKKYLNHLESSKVFPEVYDLMRVLKDNSIKIALLTTKSQEQAEIILNNFNLSDFFEIIVGKRPKFERKPSPAPLHFIGRELNIPMKNTIMIGDTELDIRCGKNAGAKTVGITLGYRTENELIRENPDFIICSLIELKKIILGENYANTW